jgi:hypothetical protein
LSWFPKILQLIMRYASSTWLNLFSLLKNVPIQIVWRLWQV